MAQKPAPRKRISLDFSLSEGGGSSLPGIPEKIDAGPQPGDKMPDGTIYAGLSPDTGKPLYAGPADAPLAMTFNEAAKYAAALDAHGHRDWRIPSSAELNVLFRNRAAIGGFQPWGFMKPPKWYWSFSQCLGSQRKGQRFNDGAPSSHIHKTNQFFVRCVRG